jgi:hypothetical protein
MGLRVEPEVPDREPDVRQILQALIDNTAGLDGWSPIGPIGVELSEAVDSTSIPLTTPESLDPQASLGLFDLTPGSSSFAERVPVHTWTPSFAYPGQAVQHALVVFPSVPLSPGGRYGFVVTRGARTASGRAFGPSAFFADALAPARPGEAPELARIRALAGEVLDGLALEAADVALALRFSVRSADDIPNDPLRMREQLHALPPPAVAITSVQPGSGSVAAIVEGTFEAPLWLEGASLKRDVAGDPAIAGMQALPFLLALPVSALGGPAPLTIVQHGSPGTFQDVVLNAETHLAAAGFATIGFTDAMNRLAGATLEAQLLAVFGNLYLGSRIVDYWIETTGEQLALVRAIGQLAGLDVLPLGSPDGVPDVDVALPLTYLGPSQGAVYGQGLLPYAPEIRAAVLAAGAWRQTELSVAQDADGDTTFYRSGIATYIPNLTPPDLWAGLALFQMALDRQDMHNHAAFLYRNPIKVGGTTRKASVLVIEALGDHTPTTQSLAWTQRRRRDHGRPRPIRARRLPRPRADARVHRAARRPLLRAERRRSVAAAHPLLPERAHGPGADPRPPGGGAMTGPWGGMRRFHRPPARAKPGSPGTNGSTRMTQHLLQPRSWRAKQRSPSGRYRTGSPDWERVKRPPPWRQLAPIGQASWLGNTLDRGTDRCPYT